jgi:hypothetical protein
MKKKSNRRARPKKAVFPVPETVIEPVPAPVEAQPQGKGLVFYVRVAFFLVILWFLGKTLWEYVPHKPKASPSPAPVAAVNNAAPANLEPTTKRMDITLKFDGIKSKWGYSGWATDGSANPNVNKSIQGTPFNIQGKKYEQGFGTHAPSEVVFDLGGKVEKFSCLVGPDTSGGTSDIIVFKVFGDSKKLFESPVLRAGVDPLPIDLNVSGVKELSLQVVVGGAEKGWGHADWLNIKFKKKEE